MQTIDDAMYFIKNTAFLGGPDTDKELTDAVQIIEIELEKLNQYKQIFQQYVYNDYTSARQGYCLIALLLAGCRKEMLQDLGMTYLVPDDAMQLINPPEQKLLDEDACMHFLKEDGWSHVGAEAIVDALRRDQMLPVSKEDLGRISEDYKSR